jgi:hypothetical protein
MQDGLQARHIEQGGLLMTDPVAVGRALVEAFKALQGWVTDRQAQQTKLEEKELGAVRAFQTAVIATSNYVGRLEAGAEGDRPREEELASLWSDAAIAFYAVNKDIAPLLHLKALSWSRPARWIDEEVVKSGITLDKMNELLTQLLRRST